MKYRCRALKPETTDWSEIEASLPEDAANSYHDQKNPPSITYRWETPNSGVVFVSFARIEVEGFGEMISKIEEYRIIRRGGVRSRDPVTLQRVAEVVGYKDDPQTLLDTWDGAETLEEAHRRKWG